MTFAHPLRFLAAAQLLLATTMFASSHARADEGNRFVRPWNVTHTLPVNSMHLTPRTCEIDQISPRPNDPLEPHALPFERTRPLILDGVMYLETGPRSGAGGVRRAAVSQCPVDKNLWELGVVPRHFDPPRYY
jgi:hypothetical protein